MPNAKKKAGTFSAEERAAMKEYAEERRAESSGKSGEEMVLAKIAGMQEPDRAMATRLHALVRATAPGLTPKTWYGMPAYARKDKIVCFFQDAKKFKSRYATLGFSDTAKLDESDMWPTAFALAKWTPEVEKRIAALVKKAVG
jgi:hypothetical protein